MDHRPPVLALFAACAAGVGCHGAPESGDDSASDGHRDSSQDTAPPAGVVVIGAGPAGLAVAAEVGALLLEASDTAGGHMPAAHGIGFFVGIPEQEPLGFADSPESAAADWPALTGSGASEEHIAFFEASPAIRDRLVAIGFTLVATAPDPILHRPRYFNLEAGEVPFTDLLEADLDPASEVRLGARVTGIALEGGRAVGVEVGDERIPAREVVIACGGYGGRADLLAPVAENPDGAWSTAGPGMGGEGDALDWATAGGWATGSLEAVGWTRDVLGLTGTSGGLLGLGQVRDAWIWVGLDGARFVNEAQSWSIDLSTPFRAHLPVWGIIGRDDLFTGRSDEERGLLEAAMAAETVLLCRDDARLTATAAGIDADGFAAELAGIAALRAAGATDAFGRDGASLPALDGPLCAFLPGQIGGKTFGGLAVDTEGRVLDGVGAPIPGLWAVGEAAGMLSPGLGGRSGFDGSITAVLSSGWRTGVALREALEGQGGGDEGAQPNPAAVRRGAAGYGAGSH